jgi:hypothetical protein
MMNKKPFLDTYRIIAVENDKAGNKRIWVEVQQDESVIIKANGNIKSADIEALASAKFKELKELCALQDERDMLEERLAQLNQQLGETEQ